MDIHTILTRGVEEVIDRSHLMSALRSGKKLRVKLGIDPTSPNIHIGRAVVLWKLRAFQELGHKVVLIVGDFTGLIGDTSDKDAERPMMAEGELRKNMKGYFDQAFKILDKNKTETHYNSEWLKKLGFKEIGEMADLFGLREVEARENVAKRMKSGKRVSLREILYPLMQGYDSVAVKADVELGGTDQRFNLLAGRAIQSLYGQSPQDILMTKLLEGTDKRKMSSSWGNVINITDDPNSMFEKVMNIRDDDKNTVLKRYLVRATNIPMREVEGLKKELENKNNTRDIKERLAEEIVIMYHGQKKAIQAKDNYKRTLFIKVAEKIKVSEDVNVVAKERAKVEADYKIKRPEQTLTFNGFLELLVKGKLASSKSEARHKIDEGAVSINGEPVVLNEKFLHTVSRGDLIRLGKRFLRIK